MITSSSDAGYLKIIYLTALCDEIWIIILLQEHVK